MLYPERLETQRLILRRPQLADAAAMFERFTSDPSVTRFMSWATHATVDDTLAYLRFATAGWVQNEDFSYLVFARDDLRLLGSTGLHPESKAELFTGYVFARDAWGKGFATEALSAMLELAPSVRTVRSVSATCAIDHAASIRVMEKCGMQRDTILKKHQVLPNLGAEPRDVVRYVKRYDR
ncbi:MAG: GNAT family N-acetyltransferase [Deltaproteobacteria bacterium]|nr:GNAT family N-acetyltransferase [Deltaproteobacteria bacterium]